MKTTLEIPDDLYRQAKAIAVLKGQTMKEWMTNLLRREVETPTPAVPPGERRQEIEAFNRKIDRLAKKISAEWQGPQDAVAAIREQRRDLGA